MKTMIAIPCMDTVPYEFMQSMLSLEKTSHGYISVCCKANSLVYDSRNLLSLTAIENGFDRVMWFDSDMIVPQDAMRMLHDDLDSLKGDMVTGLYITRNGKNMPVIYDQLDMPGADENGNPVKKIHDYLDYPRDKVFPVKGCGFGCVLTSTALLKDVWDHFGPAFTPYPWAGEDISFCYRANMLGYQIWCDSRVKCGHIGKHIFTEQEVM